jgi:WS/DGAT/MGAT family acyltransferase
MYVIEGLDNVEGIPAGSFATFTKTHHAAVDGTSGMELTAAIHDLSPDYKLGQRATMIRVDSRPSGVEMLLRSQLNTLRKPFHFVSVARNTVPGMARAVAGLSRGKLSRVGTVPRTRFNRRVSPHRVFNAVNVPLDDIKAIKNAHPGATVNDAAITIVGGALRKYLSAHNELPGESQVAMAPVNVRSDKDSTGGNLVSTLTVQVRSDIEDAAERLAAVHEGTRNAKELNNAIGAKAMTDYSRFIPSTLTAQGARLASRWGLANRISPIFNCVITNVPGPPIPLFNTGAKMVANYGTGPVTDGLGLFHVISSYCGQFVISATSDREMMPDPDFYRQCLLDSFADSLAAARKALEAPRKKAPRRKSRKTPSAA